MDESVRKRISIVLEALIRNAEKRQRNTSARQPWEVNASSAGKYGLQWIVSLNEIQLPWKDEGETTGKALLLWRPEKNPLVLPVLNLRWNNLDSASPEFRVRLGLFVKIEESTGKCTGLGFTGMRWETPERTPYLQDHASPSRRESVEAGRHDFYHCQPIRGFERGDKLSAILACGWHPDKLPTIPVPAENPFDLLWFALYSVYEKEWLKLFNEMKSRIHLDIKEIERLLRGVGHD